MATDQQPVDSSDKPVYSRAEQRAWYVYDWANSAFYTTVVTLFLGPYLTSLARSAADANGNVHLLGIPLAAQSIWPYSVSASVLTQVLALPLFGAIADYGRRKREMLGALAAVGSLATMAMFFVDGGRWLLGVLLFLIANFTFGASIVIYNSFLPEIAAPDQRDAVSSRGWALGYIGGGLLLILNLLLYSNAAALGINGAFAVRISLAAAGLWWALFSIYPVRRLRNRGPRKDPAPGEHYVTAGLRQLLRTLREVRAYPMTLLFLIAYLVYNDGIQTVISMAAQFGSEELKFQMATLTTAILITQFVGVVGALAFNWLAQRIGGRRAVMVSLAIWAATLIYIFRGVRSAPEFYAAAAVIGFVLGGSQALSRSLYSLMVPKGQEAEYFSIYEISDKGTSWLGPLFFGLALQWTGSFRLAILSLILFFLFGLLLLAKLDVRRAALEAGNDPPVRY
jgi:UMF1 family MFS transporter